MQIIGFKCVERDGGITGKRKQFSDIRRLPPSLDRSQELTVAADLWEALPLTLPTKPALWLLLMLQVPTSTRDGATNYKQFFSPTSQLPTVPPQNQPGRETGRTCSSKASSLCDKQGAGKARMELTDRTYIVYVQRIPTQVMIVIAANCNSLLL